MEFIEALDRKIAAKKSELEKWIDEQCRRIVVPLYTSVDLRVSSHKIAAVDTNIFPAGFNNLRPVFRESAARLFQDYFIRKYPRVDKILIIPEILTRNTYYWENVYVLKGILEGVGFMVEVGLISDELYEDEVRFRTASGRDIRAYRTKRDGSRVSISPFIPDLLLINNDFSSNCPKILRDIRQPVEPPVEIGWHTRRKNIHFEFYNKLAAEVAEIIGIDPWTISIETAPERDIDFDNPEDREKAAASADLMLYNLMREYNERGIQDKPLVFVKSSSGTYGMAVISVFSGDEIRSLKSGGRKRMRVSKGGKPVRDVVIQEGIPTSLRFSGGVVGEPVVYLVEAKVAGGFLRLNRGRTQYENLNTKGMEFSCICFEKESAGGHGDCEKLFPLAYQIVARTASIAAGYEIEKVLREGGCREESAADLAADRIF